MKFLLTERLPKHFEIDKIIKLKEVVYYRPFSLSDPVACKACKDKFVEKSECNGQAMNIKTAIPLHVVDYEDYILQFRGTTFQIGQHCDYLLYDNNERGRGIAFCDLTCSAKEHVNYNIHDSYPLGKRFKAFEQMKKTLETLLDVDLLNYYILTCQRKYALFGWREKDPSVGSKDRAAESMEIFGVTPSSAASTIYTDIFVVGHGFKFIQVKYPSYYEWDKQQDNLNT